MRPLRRIEFHIYDRDVPDYKNFVDGIVARGDGSWAVLTSFIPGDGDGSRAAGIIRSALQNDIRTIGKP